MKTTFLIFSLSLCSSLWLNSQTFTSLEAFGHEKKIEWTTSTHGNGFGHKIFSYDPGGMTLLNFAARHNSTTWTNLMTLTSTGKIGLGTTNPTERLEVYGNAIITSLNPTLSITGTGFGSYHGASLILSANGVSSGNEHVSTWFMNHRNTDGTATVELQRRNATNDYRGALMYYRDNYGWDFRTAENATSTAAIARVTIKNSGNVGIGTTTPDSKLTVKGNIHTNEVKVDLLGAVAPDYVFQEDYDLKSLKEVEDYISINGHLPNIPSAKDMETNGIMLKEMNLKLLEKIEELTLYVIEQNKKLEEFKLIEQKLTIQEINAEKLKDRLQKIETLLSSKQ